jgi:pimeloyl-ACP methyl ester carboxylesterase
VGSLSRPGGIAIDWEQRGDGPLLYVAHNPMVATPRTFEAVLADLGRDHRVVTWDPRGTGRSSPGGPYDLYTDAADLAALIEELGAGVTLSLGYNHAPLVVAENHPELVAAAVLVGALPRLPPADGEEPESLLTSGAVGAAVQQLALTDPRALLRSWVELGNPQLDETGLHERVEAQVAYCPVSAGLPRVESYLNFGLSDAYAALGDRLWIVTWTNPIHTDEQVARVRARLPQANVVDAADGPISRPDLTAAAVRRATAARRSRTGGPLGDQ